MRNRQDENLQQVRVELLRDNVASGNGPKGEAKPSHPARPTSVERRPKGAFLLCEIELYFFTGARFFQICITA